MPGVRLHHPTLSGCLFIVPVAHRPYKVPYTCPTCRTIHQVKTYHLNLDAQGDTIVSVEIYDRLKEVDLAGMTFENEVANPPPITLNLGGGPLTFKIFEHKVKEEPNGQSV